jgi:hypothetical protein
MAWGRYQRKMQGGPSETYGEIMAKTSEKYGDNEVHVWFSYAYRNIDHINVLSSYLASP